MIIARSPLRISLGGGGTDVPSYYQEYEGFLIAAAINRYVYVTVMRPFTEGIYLKYSEIEQVNNVSEVIRLEKIKVHTDYDNYISSKDRGEQLMELHMLVKQNIKDLEK